MWAFNLQHSEACMVIRHVGVWSVARLYGALSASMGLIFGGIVALISLAGGAAGFAHNADSPSGPLAMMFGVGAIVFLPVFYGILGLCAGAIGAALYNVFAGMLGGIELDIQQ
jgi:hypothetical protein